MKQRSNRWMVAMAALGAAACGGMEINSDFDPQAAPGFSAYRTYSWMPPPRGADTRVYNPITEARVVRAVEVTLRGRGYQQATGAPDFRIGWHAALEGRADVRSMNTYYGYGWGRWGGGGVVMTDGYVDNYDQGTLVLDIVDGRSNELVWRGTAQARIEPSNSPEERQRRINEAVRKMLERFPPGQ